MLHSFRLCSASHCHCAQVLPFHRTHLRAWRFSCLEIQTPLRRVIPGPHAAAIWVIMLFGCWTGASGAAWADDISATAKATATSLIMFSSLCCEQTQLPSSGFSKDINTKHRDGEFTSVVLINTGTKRPEIMRGKYMLRPLAFAHYWQTRRGGYRADICSALIHVR